MADYLAVVAALAAFAVLVVVLLVWVTNSNVNSFSHAAPLGLEPVVEKVRFGLFRFPAVVGYRPKNTKGVVSTTLEVGDKPGAFFTGRSIQSKQLNGESPHDLLKRHGEELIRRSDIVPPDKTWTAERWSRFKHALLLLQLRYDVQICALHYPLDVKTDGNPHKLHESILSGLDYPVTGVASELDYEPELDQDTILTKWLDARGFAEYITTYTMDGESMADHVERHAQKIRALSPSTGHIRNATGELAFHEILSERVPGIQSNPGYRTTFSQDGIRTEWRSNVMQQSIETRREKGEENHRLILRHIGTLRANYFRE